MRARWASRLEEVMRTLRWRSRTSDNFKIFFGGKSFENL